MSALAPFEIDPCRHPRIIALGPGLHHCPDCSTGWSQVVYDSENLAERMLRR